MAPLLGNVASDGVSVTLTSGSLPPWAQVGNQVNGVIGNGSSDGLQGQLGTNVVVSGLFSPGLPWNTQAANAYFTYIAHITDPTHFTLSSWVWPNANCGSLLPPTSNPGQSYSGCQFFISDWGGDPFSAGSGAWVRSAMASSLWQNATLSPISVATPLGGPLYNSKYSSPGYGGSDGCVSIDLRNAGAISGHKYVLWAFADTDWSRATNATRNAGMTFIHNSIMMQQIADTSTFHPNLANDTCTFYDTPTAGGPEGFFPNSPPCDWQWPFSGYCGGPTCLLIVTNGVQIKPDTTGTQTTFGYTPASYHINWVSNVGSTSDPTAWNMVDVPHPFNHETFIPRTFTEITISGTTYVYCIGVRFLNSWPRFICRFNKAELIAPTLTGNPPDFSNPEWWGGGAVGWMRGDIYKNNPAMSGRMVPIVLPTTSPVLNTGLGPWQKTGVQPDGNFNIHKRPSDGHWVQINFLIGTGNIYAGTTANITDLVPTTFGQPIAAPYQTGFRDAVTGLPLKNWYYYGANSHPEQAWLQSGVWYGDGQSDDVLCSINTNEGDSLAGVFTCHTTKGSRTLTINSGTFNTFTVFAGLGLADDSGVANFSATGQSAIPTGTLITAVPTSTTITMSNPAAKTISADAVRISKAPDYKTAPVTVDNDMSSYYPRFFRVTGV